MEKMTNRIPFDDIDKRQEKRQLKKRLHQAIKQLANQLRNPADKEKMLKFVDCLSYTGFTDVSVLSYYSPDAPLCKVNNKNECLFSQVCAVIQNWWMYSQEDFAFEDMLVDVERLEKIQLNKCFVNGNIREGYYLES